MEDVTPVLNSLMNCRVSTTDFRNAVNWSFSCG